jgi:hypothetical protein
MNPENLTDAQIVTACLAATKFCLPASLYDPRIEATITLIEQLQSRPDCTPQAGEWLDAVLAVLTRPATEAKP